MSKEERRLQLLSAARDVFVSKGFHDAKVDDIVAIARVAKGTFYLYFPDKRSVFSELVDGLFKRIGEAILRVEPSADVEAQVKHNIRAIVSVLLDEPGLTLLLSYASGLDPEFLAKIRSFYEGVTGLLQRSLEAGQKLGIVADGDTRLFAKFTIGAVKELLLEKATSSAIPDATAGAAPAPERPYGREEIVSSVYDFLQGGYLRIAPGPAPAPKSRSAAPATARTAANSLKRAGPGPKPQASAKRARAKKRD
jgi:AcrR family transcriptional regulator